MKRKSPAAGSKGNDEPLITALRKFTEGALKRSKLDKETFESALVMSTARKESFKVPVDWVTPATDIVHELHVKLGPRNFRLLLSAYCRQTIRQFSHGRIGTDQAKALVALEEFADTGKGKTALSEWWRISKARWNTRQFRYLLALQHSLSPPDPEPALIPALLAYRDAFKLSEQQAWDQFQQFYRELVSPLLAPDDFAGTWRTPSVVEMARSKYESRDFGEMPRLADALEQAGCQLPAILDHCRDPNAIHFRGCWVVDAVLDGSWAQVPKAAKTSKKKTLLSQVPLRGRHQITKIMEERDGQLPLDQFLAKRWDVVGFRKSPSRSVEDVAKKVAEWQSQLAQLHPQLSPDQIQMVMSFGQLTTGLREAAIARRFALEDPAELARGLGVLSRLERIQKTWSTTAKSDSGSILEACVVRDVADVQEMVGGTRAGFKAIPDEQDLVDIAEVAILQQDFDTLRCVTAEMPKRKVRPWQQGIYNCLIGVSERRPDQVAGGLQLLLTGLHQMRQKDELSEAINLGAHGLYRLCEWVSSDLVSGFDVNQRLPWDAEFHAWCENHPDPLEGVDLTGVSPVLHEAVVLRKPPAWLTPPPKELYEIVLIGGDPKLPRILEAVGDLAGTSGSLREARQLFERPPLVLCWNLNWEIAEMERDRLELAGAIVEVRAISK